MMLSDKQKALVYHLIEEESFDPKEAIEVTRDNTDEEDIERNDDLGLKYDITVYTDSEADEEWDLSLDSYIDDCLEIPKEIEYYFDRDKWKDDARMDGRGHSLSYYDGEEFAYKVNNEWFYIYRQ